MVVSPPERLTALCEHRGGDPDSDSWQGKEDRDVVMLALLPWGLGRQRLKNSCEALFGFGPLRVKELQAGQRMVTC